MAFIIATRKFPIGLLAVVLAALLGAACGSGSTAKPDGGGSDGSSDGGGGDHVTSSNLLVGMIAPGAPSPCITESLQLSGGQAQCTVVQHLSSASGGDQHDPPLLQHRQPGPLLVAGDQPQLLSRRRVDVHVRSRPGQSGSESQQPLVRL